MILKEQLSRWRIKAMIIMLCVMPAALVWNLATLQVFPWQAKGYRFLQSQGEARTLRSEKLRAYRGMITDRNGQLLAVSTPVKSLFLNPQNINHEQIPLLANALGMAEEKLRTKLTQYKEKQFMYLARHMPPHEADAVLDRKFSGVYSETEYRRYYPAGEVVSHVVGFTDIDDVGREGVELAFNDWMAGTEGSKRVIKDLKGNIVREDGIWKSPIAGKDLQLTIDLRLQYAAYSALKSAVRKQNAKAGTVVVLDAKTKEILAMVNQPSYNPNDRRRVKPNQMRNRALTDVFEPGSTVKPFTVMAALKSGRYTPDFAIDTSPGYVVVGNKTLVDHTNYGVMTLSKMITKSSQVGITKLALAIQADPIRQVFFDAGLGQPTGVGFPGESVGVLPMKDKWRKIEVANFAFGYGLSVNAVQLAQAYAMVASLGKFKNVSLVKNTGFEQPEHQVVSEEIAQQVLDMLKTVPEKGGTGTRAQIDEYPVAGKTGTAHKVGRYGYADDRYIAFFAGFAPADNPRVVAAVVIDEPGDGRYFGGEAAAPVFARVVEDSLRVMNEPPVVRDNFLAKVRSEKNVKEEAAYD